MDHDDFSTDMPKGYGDTVEMDPSAQPNKKASDEDLDKNFERAMEISPKAQHKEETSEDYDPTILPQHSRQNSNGAIHLSEAGASKNVVHHISAENKPKHKK